VGPDLRVIFCGINPGFVSAAASAHFANPRNDFWRLLHDAGFTPRLLAPGEQFEALRFGIGLTNAASRTTRGSGDLCRRDFHPERLERLAAELAPQAIAFVGKEAYRGLFGERPELGLQQRTLGDVSLFVLPLDLSRQRGSFVLGAAALVRGAARLARAARPTQRCDYDSGLTKWEAMAEPRMKPERVTEL
jgi:TDG/mug DNA glycosylase family protein